MENPTPPRPSDTLGHELEALRQEIARLNRNKYLRIQGSVWRMMGHSFLRGLAMGLGTVVGATVLVSVMVYFLSQIDFIPIVGDWAAEIAREIQAEE